MRSSTGLGETPVGVPARGRKYMISLMRPGDSAGYRHNMPRLSFRGGGLDVAGDRDGFMDG
jgi:hypothetical protein